MKKILAIIIVILLVVAGAYLILSIDKESTETNGETIYSSEVLNLEFKYRTGPEGYTIEEREINQESNTEPFYSIVLIPSADADKEMPKNGEGPATITIQVFNNIDKDQPANWAEKNVIYSNLNLKTGDVAETVVGGANAIRYMADGLYASDNVVVAHGNRVYLLTGMFIDAESSLRKDFSPLVESVRFIPGPLTSEQE